MYSDILSDIYSVSLSNIYSDIISISVSEIYTGILCDIVPALYLTYILAFYLALYLTVYRTYFRAFYLEYFWLLSDIYSSSLPGIYYDILCAIFSNILSDVFSDNLSDIYSDLLSFICLTYVLTVYLTSTLALCLAFFKILFDILSNILSDILFWRPVWQINLTVFLSVGVRQCPLRLGACSCGPAMSTAIKSWQGGRRWRRRRRTMTPLIKSHNPHLAGVEKNFHPSRGLLSDPHIFLFVGQTVALWRRKIMSLKLLHTLDRWGSRSELPMQSSYKNKKK